MSTPFDLFEICMKLNKEDFHVQLGFMGHINSFSLHAYPGGYEEMKYKNFDYIFEADRIPEAIKWLTEENAKYRGLK